MNGPFNTRTFWFEIVAVLVIAAIDKGHNEMYLSLVALVILVYTLQCLARIFNEVKRIADYLETLKNREYGKGHGKQGVEPSADEGSAGTRC